MGRPQRPHTRTSKHGSIFSAGRGALTKAGAWGKKQMTKKNAKAIAAVGAVVATSLAVNYIKGKYFVENSWDHVRRKREFDYKGYSPRIFRGMGGHFLGGAQQNPPGGTPFDFLFLAGPFHTPGRTVEANALVIGKGQVALVPSVSDYLNWNGDELSDPRLWVDPMTGIAKRSTAAGYNFISEVYTIDSEDRTTVILNNGRAIDLIGNSVITARPYRPGEEVIPKEGEPASVVEKNGGTHK